MNKDARPLKGFIHSIETLGAVDGPGLRTVVFFQGCPLNCQYCHNVDCVDKNAGTVWTEDNLIAELIKNKPYWHTWDINSAEVRGGVTISGGEPTLQSRFLLALADRLKQEKIHLAIDTSLFTSTKVIDSLLPYVDLWMVSLKHLDDEQHKTLTGVSNRTILSNIKYLDEQLGGEKKLRLRVVVLPGYTDSESYADSLVGFCQKLVSLEVVEILPYREFGKYKWIEKYGDYPLEGTPEATEANVKILASALTKAGINCLY